MNANRPSAGADVRFGQTPQSQGGYLARGMVLASLVLLQACASVSPEGGFADVAKIAKDRLGKDIPWVRTLEQQERADRRMAELLAKPLSVDDAVELALLNNRGLQASFQELGMAEADLVQAGRPPNPGFSFGRTQRGEEREIERGLHISLARVLAMPLIVKMEAQRFEHTKRLVAMGMLSLAANTRKAYFNAVAAEETLRYMRRIKQAADASSELARRMEQVGNFNKLQRAREQMFQADAALRLARAEQAQRVARERLVRLLGVWGTQSVFSLPDRLPDLPDLPAEALDMPNIEQVVMAQRLDVQAAKLAAEQTARSLGLVRTTRFINLLELGAAYNTSNEASPQRGWEVSVELPLFDGGGARVAKAEAVYLQAVHRAADTAIRARSEVREAYTGYRAAYDIARFQREEMVPLSQRISEENLLRYNGMLIGVFELLADARAQIAVVQGSIQALRDFWIAQADLDMALIGKPDLTVEFSVGLASQPTAADH